MLHDNIYGRCANILGNSNDQIEFDIDLFLQRILLFENFTLETIRLKEIPLLAEKIGIDGLILLLECDFFKIHCEALSIGQIGQTSVLKSVQEKGVLPLFSYRFASVSMADFDHYIDGCLNEIKKIPNLTEKKRKIIKRLIRSKLVLFKPETRGAIYSSFCKDLALKNLVLLSLKQDTKVSDDLKFELNRVNDNDWKVETNLSSLINIDDNKSHKIIERALLKISGLSRKIYEMHDFDSLTGFQQDEDFYIFEERLRPLSEKFSDDTLRKNFMRLLEIQKMPDFKTMVESGNFSMKKLLKIRQTKECEEFRKWLWNSGNFSEKEIQDRVRSLRGIFGNFLDSGSGKTIRFGSSTVIGMINPIMGLGLSVVDTFLLDKFFKKDGISVFINKQYPRLYE